MPVEPTATSNWTIPEDRVDAAAQTASELARVGNHQGGSALPELSNSVSKLEESWVRRFQEWLSSLFQSGSSPKFDVAFALHFLKWIAIGLLIIGIAYLIYRLVTRSRGPATNTKSAAAIPTLSTEALERDLSTALKAGHFAKAARLRWRLHLVRGGANPDTTPYEHFRKQRATIDAWLAKQYWVMFSGATPTRPDYDEVDVKLTSYESKAGSP